MVTSTTPSSVTAPGMLVADYELAAAAGTAAAAARVRMLVRLAGGLVLDLEGVAAPATRRRVRIVDREAALQPVDEVDLGALQIRRAEAIDDDPDAVRV